MEGLAADDANELLLENFILDYRQKNPNASKEMISLLNMTRIAYAGNDSENEKAGKRANKTKDGQPTGQGEEKKEESKKEEEKKEDTSIKG